MVIVYGTQMFN